MSEDNNHQGPIHNQHCCITHRRTSRRQEMIGRAHHRGCNGLRMDLNNNNQTHRKEHHDTTLSEGTFADNNLQNPIHMPRCCILRNYHRTHHQDRKGKTHCRVRGQLAWWSWKDPCIHTHHLHRHNFGTMSPQNMSEDNSLHSPSCKPRCCIHCHRIHRPTNLDR